MFEVFRQVLEPLEQVGTPPAALTGVAARPQDVRPGSLFVALREPPGFDGHELLAAARAAGASACAIDRQALDVLGTSPLPAYLVDSTTWLWGQLAQAYRRQLRYPIVAVTGSAGKTTTKELVAEALCAERSPGNRNNLHGAPLSLLEFAPEAPFGVVEIGTSLPGEIARLAEIVEPDVGVITNIGPTHLEGLGSLAGVASEKGALFAALGPGGVAVANADDPLVLDQLSRFGGDALVRFAGSANTAADVFVRQATVDPESIRAEVVVEGTPVELVLPHPGLFNLTNAVCALAVAVALGVDVEAALANLAAAQLPPERFEVIRLGERLLIDDSYNANPQAVRAAVRSLVELAGGWPAVLCLADMAELGTRAASLHQELGAWLAGSGLARLYTVGPLAARVSEEAAKHGLAARHLPDKASLGRLVAREPAPGVYLVKGSRSTRMEHVVDALRRAWQPGGRYFSNEEIACRCGCGFDQADPEFLDLLDTLRERLARPLMVSSFCRCVSHNRRVGGIPDSPHLEGQAVDLMCTDDLLRQRLVTGWIELVAERNRSNGKAPLPVRIEFGYDYLHLDIDRRKPNQMWFNELNFKGFLTP